MFYWVLWKNWSIVTFLDVCIRCFTRCLHICDNNGVTLSNCSTAVKSKKIWNVFNASVIVGLGSKNFGSSSSISNSICRTDKIASSQPSSKISKAGMSSITISSSNSIPVTLARWNISSWSWAGRSSCSESVASSFKPTFWK